MANKNGAGIMGGNLELFEEAASTHEKKQMQAQAIAAGQGKGRPAMEVPTFNVTIRLTQDEHKKLKLLAVERNVSVSSILRGLIQENL